MANFKQLRVIFSSFFLPVFSSGSGDSCDVECNRSKIEGEFQSGRLEALYNDVPAYLFDCKDAQSAKNIYRNRYSDILPYDSTRVRLTGKSEYINANYVNMKVGEDVHKWIATQDSRFTTYRQLQAVSYN